MEKQYKDINLKAIRETAKIDFAHFTYQKGQCSCCYGPLKFPARYWTGGKKTKEYFEDNPNEEYSYILFKNAYNGSGTVTKEDFITNHTYISYGNITDEQMNVIIEMLQSQLGEGYEVIKPENKFTCIEIVTK
jgi:hypothetical protein